MPSAVHEVLFPLDIALKSAGGPERRTEIVTLGSGREERNARWAHSRRYDAGYGVRTFAALSTVVAFFEERRGRLYGFRWRDRLDHSSAGAGAPGPLDQTLGTGDGVQTTFALVKTYSGVHAPYQRPIAKPVAGSVRVSVDGVEQTEGVDFVCDPSTGITPAAEQIMGKQDPLSDGRCLCGLCVLETITRVADAVQDTPRRRKVLLFIGTNVIWQSTRSAAQAGLDTGCEVPLKDARNAMFAAVDRANLTVHSIDPQGLVNLGPQTQTSSRGGFDMPGPLGGPARRLAQQQTAISDSQTNLQNLQVLPARTGGRTVAGRNNPEGVVPAIFQESEAYYVLGIERGTSGRQEDTRSIEVKVARRGARVFAQRHYVLPPASPNATAEPQKSVGPATPQEALNRLLPSAGRPLSLAVAAFVSPDNGRAMVRLDVDAGGFAREGATAAPLDFAIVAVDQTGRSVASARQTSTITAPRPASGRAAEVNVQSRLELTAGNYQVRVAVSDPASGAVASVFSDVTVPEFDRAPLSVSGVTVDVRSPPSAPPVPTTRRVFRRGEQVRALLQIYQGTERTEAIAPVSMRVQILDAKGGAVRDQSLPFTEKTFTNRRADCVITLPIANLSAGEYLLKLEASLDRRTAGRALRFAVE
jgi:uncharacterized protein (TIGR02217 family)